MREQFYYGHGKLLLTSEYFVLDGARALCLPTNVGQTMNVKYRASYDPKIHWKSFDYQGNVWFEASFDRWKLNPIDNDSNDAKVLSDIFKQARKQNIHFLRDEVDVHVETRLEFPLDWGLGSSSTLIYNIAQLAYVSPFELLTKTLGGSGYDIACAQSMGPIQFQNINGVPNWKEVTFSPHFKDQIYFLYLNKKMNSRDEVKKFKDLKIDNKEEIIKELNKLNDAILSAVDLKEFEELMFEHENLISKAISKERIQNLYFKDYEGVVKSLGAWGGDFALVTSKDSFIKTKEYFRARGFETLIPYDEIIRQNFPSTQNLTLSESEIRIQ